MKPSSVLTRVGCDVTSKLEISIPQAVLGGHKIATGLYKSLKVIIPRGSSSHDIVRIRNEGFSRPNMYGRGDHLVELIIRSPSSVTANQKALLELFARENPDYSGKVEGMHFESQGPEPESEQSESKVDESVSPSDIVQRIAKLIKGNKPTETVWQEFVQVLKDIFNFFFSKK